MSRQEIELRYKRWLIGKHIDGVEIVDVWYTAPPSGFTGVVSVRLETGDWVGLTPVDTNAFRLRKKDLKWYIDEYKEGK